MTSRTFAIGGDLTVNRLGYGAMRLTGQPSNFGPFPDWRAGLALVRRAQNLGIDFIDSAYAYGPLHADQLVGEALEGRKAVIATKGGVDKPEPGRIIADASRDTLLRQIDEQLTALRRDQIDLYQLHRIDPQVPLEVSLAALREAQEDGRIRHIGLSNVTLQDLRRAQQVAPIASVQNRFNMADLEQAPLVKATAAEGIAFIPYGPLGAHPMRQGAKLAPREALAWLLRYSPNIIVIPGTTAVAHLEENWRAWEDVSETPRT
ncbi:MAG: aldo/keto reductase [Pseudomonadota bacterium]